jgi:hypothetical protein
MRKNDTIGRSDLRAFISEAPPLTAAAVLGISGRDERAVADATTRLARLAKAVGATRLAWMASVLADAAESHQLHRVPDDVGLGHAVADVVDTCRAELDARGLVRVGVR